jgi:hypothetical protein
MLHFSVIPAKAGIQNILIKLDSRLRGKTTLYIYVNLP